MISQNTVLVLGAGASMPYGYPSGKALRDQIAGGRFDPKLSEYFDRVPRDSITQFSQSFLSSQLPSIDEFLSGRGLEQVNVDVTFEQIGKAAISLALRENRRMEYLLHMPSISVEGQTKYNLDYSDHWYQYLWKRLCDDIPHDEVDKLADNQITVLTFNYDLSLEFYLLEACSATFGIPKKRAASILSKLKIVHLYGRLSGNPLTESSSEPPEYAQQTDDNQWRSQLYSDIRSINVMYESRQQSNPVFDSAYQALEAADIVCFLGFGFDPVNTRRLRISDALQKRYSAYRPGTGNVRYPTLYATLPYKTRHQRQLAVNEVWSSAVRSGAYMQYHSPPNHIDSSEARWLTESDFKNLPLLNETGAF
jgi:hypothetical protein